MTCLLHQFHIQYIRSPVYLKLSGHLEKNPTLAFCNAKYMNSGTNFLQFPMQELHKTLLVIVWASKTWACCLIKSCQCIPDSTPKTFSSMLGSRSFFRRSVYPSVERTDSEDQMDQKEG